MHNCKYSKQDFKKLPTEFPDVFEIFCRSFSEGFSDYIYVGMLKQNTIYAKRSYSSSLSGFLQWFPTFVAADDDFDEISIKISQKYKKLIVEDYLNFSEEDWKRILPDYVIKAEKPGYQENLSSFFNVLLTYGEDLFELSRINCMRTAWYICVNETSDMIAAMLTDYDTSNFDAQVKKELSSMVKISDLEDFYERLTYLKEIEQDLQNPDSILYKISQIYLAIKDYSKVEFKLKGIDPPLSARSSDFKYAARWDGFSSRAFPNKKSHDSLKEKYFFTRGVALIPYSDIEEITFLKKKVLWTP